MINVILGVNSELETLMNSIKKNANSVRSKLKGRFSEFYNKIHKTVPIILFHDNNLQWLFSLFSYGTKDPRGSDSCASCGHKNTKSTGLQFLPFNCNAHNRFCYFTMSDVRKSNISMPRAAERLCWAQFKACIKFSLVVMLIF